MLGLFGLILLILLAALLSSPYVFYPLALRLVAGPRPPARARPRPLQWPTVSVLIPAHNEERLIVTKLMNTLALDYPRDKLEIIVASDGSRDRTLARLGGFPEVHVLQWSERRGKSFALSQLLEHARGELVLFTDVSAQLRPDTLNRLVSELAAEDLGAVMPRYATRDERANREESTYWRLETRLKQDEARLGLLFGAHGACYLARRDLVPPLAPDTICDDMVIPLRMRCRGARIGYVAEAVAFDTCTLDCMVLFRRWARIAHGNLQAASRYGHEVRGALAFAFFAHKVLKTFGPILLAVLALLSTTLTQQHSWLAPLTTIGWASLLVGAGCAYLLAQGYPLVGVPRTLGLGVLAQLACLVGVGRFLVGAEGVLWRREMEHEPLTFDLPARPPLSVRIVKRALDLVVASLGLTVCAPVMLGLCALIRLESKGAPLYAQERLGFDARGRRRPFTMYKLRSMRHDAEAGGAAWATQDDPRVTRLGRFLRRARLDELPQLWNVLLGDMSLVGPRPERAHFVAQLEREVPGYLDRLVPVKPGVTGWAQVHCGYDTSVDSVREKLLYDFTYNAHLYSLKSYLVMELRVLVRTVFVMVHGRGAR